LVSAGAVFTSVFGSVVDRVLTVQELEANLTKPASLIYISIELTGLFVAHMLLTRKVLSPEVRGVSLGVMAGVLMGNVFCVKGVIGLVHNTIFLGDTDPWWRPTPYILIMAAGAGAVLGHVFMRKGLGEYKGVFMVTIFEGAHISAACLSGCIVMSEMAHAPWWQYVLYWVSVGLIIAGILAINSAAMDSKMNSTHSRKPKRTFHLAQSFTPSEEGNKQPLLRARHPSGMACDTELCTALEEGRASHDMDNPQDG